MNREEFNETVEDWNLEYFSPYEFLVRCDEPENTYPPEELWDNLESTAKVLDIVRRRLEAPIYLTSVYRSPEYNRKVGGATYSRHIQFKAIDWFSPKGTPEMWHELAEEVFANLGIVAGIGLYDTFIHIDSPSKVPRRW